MIKRAKDNLILILSAVIIIITLILAASIFTPSLKESITHLSQSYFWLIPFLIILARILGVVIPPITGGWISLLMIPYLGWFPVYIFDVIGGLAGSTIAFWLARKYREKILVSFLSLNKVVAWEKKISPKNHLMTFFALRLLTGPISDYVSYIAGLTTISLANYVIATFLSIALGQLTLIYLANLGFTVNLLFLVFLVLPLGLSIFVYKKWLKS